MYFSSSSEASLAMCSSELQTLPFTSVLVALKIAVVISTYFITLVAINTVRVQFNTPGPQLKYCNDGDGGREGGEGGEKGPRDLFGAEILAKRDFLGSMKDAGSF